MNKAEEKPTPEVDIADFTFDDDDENFFGIKDLSNEDSGVVPMTTSSDKPEPKPKDEAAPKKKVVDDDDEEEDEPVKEPVKKPKKKEEDKGEDEEPFKDPLPHPGRDANKDVDGDIDKFPEDFYTNLALDMKDMGILSEDIEVDEKTPIALEDFMELQSREIDSRVSEEIEAFAEDMDDDGKAFINFKRKGGNTQDFLSKYLAPSFNLPTFDEENKDHISYVIDHYLRNIEKLEGEELEDRKVYIKDSGREKERATKYYDKLKKADEERKKAIMKAVEDRAVQAEREAAEFNGELRDIVSNNTKLNNFALSKEDKKSLVDYMALPAVKIGKNKYIPQFQAEIRRILTGATDRDKKDLLTLAKIVKAKFDPKEMITKAETEITKGIKSRLAHKSNGVRATSGVGRKIKELADDWED